MSYHFCKEPFGWKPCHFSTHDLYPSPPIDLGIPIISRSNVLFLRLLSKFNDPERIQTVFIFFPIVRFKNVEFHITVHFLFLSVITNNIVDKKNE